MAKKNFLKDLKTGKHHKKSKLKQQQNVMPETEDDFLAAGVELEESGEKWRVGDPVKGMRFYMRAVEMYDNGLKKYPNAFDLAYNKARTQYEVTQHPKLSKQLPAPLVDVLNASLESHRAALVLNQENVDILFNTAQVLTSLAEALIDDGRTPNARPANDDDGRSDQAVRHLLEALDLFQRCCTLQEFHVSQNEEELAEAKKRFEEQANASSLQEESAQDFEPTGRKENDSLNGSNENDEQWATVVEPITRDSIIDTVIAQLQALSTLCGLLTADHSDELAWIEEYSTGLITEKLPLYTKDASGKRITEAALARAAFVSSLAEASYRVHRLDIETYRREVTNAFSESQVGDISSSSDSLVVQAEALTSFSNAIGDVEPFPDPYHPCHPYPDSSRNPAHYRRAQELRWQALSSALDSLTKATKLPMTEQQKLPRIHMARGDTEMLRWRLGAAPWSHPPAVQHGAVLLSNAQTYYRGAAALARQQAMHGAVDALAYEAEGLSKEAIAAALGGNVQKLANLLAGGKGEVMRRAEEMVDDGLADTQDVKKVWQLVDPDVTVRME